MGFTIHVQSYSYCSAICNRMTKIMHLEHISTSAICLSTLHLCPFDPFPSWAVPSSGHMLSSCSYCEAWMVWLLGHTWARLDGGEGKPKATLLQRPSGHSTATVNATIELTKESSHILCHFTTPPVSDWNSCPLCYL